MAAGAEKYGTAEQLAAELARASTPMAVLIVLQNWSRLHFGLSVFGLWALPRYFKDSFADWHEGENLWFHPDVCDVVS